MLYPRPSVSKLLKAKPALNQAVWQALNQIPVAALVGEGRVYGGGLYKIEPKELGNAPAGGVVAALGAGGHGRGRQELLFE
jgi:adenine-specific DNA-methyltransferase